MNWGNRRAWAVAAAVALGWLVALTAPRDFSVGNFVDDAHYAVLAKALREQGAYRTINLPDAVLATTNPGLHYLSLGVYTAPGHRMLSGGDPEIELW